MARRDLTGVRLLTRNGHDWATRFPLIVEAVNHLAVRSLAARSTVAGFSFLGAIGLNASRRELV
jgi:hypothetical protein